MEKMAHFFSLKTSRKDWMKTRLLVIGILLLAAFFRLYKISDYMTFLGDEGRDVLVAYNILHGNFTLLGPTASVGGFFLGPIYYYFMTPFLWLFNYDPVGPAVMVALFGVATVFLVYKVGSEFFDKRVGIMAAFLYALSPVVIAYSRSSWNPNLMPFFSLLTLYVLYKAMIKNKTYLFILCGFLLGITMQLHYLAIFLGAIMITYVILIRLTTLEKFFLAKISWILKDGFYLFFGFIVGWLPFLAFEIRHGFPNLSSIVQFIIHQESRPELENNSGFIATVGNVFFRLFGRLITKFPPPEQISLANQTNIAIWYYLTLLLAIASVAVFVIKYYKTIRQKDHDFQKLSLIFLWGTVGILLFGFYTKNIYDYYFGFLFPIPFLLISYFLSFLWRRKSILQYIPILIFLLLVSLNLSGIPFQFTPNRQKDQVRQIAEFVLSKTNEKPYNFALITGGNSDHGYRYFFKLENRDPVVIQNSQIDPERKTVTDQLLIVCEDSACQPLGNSLWEVAGFGRAEIIDRWDVSVVQVYKLTHYKGKE